MPRYEGVLLDVDGTLVDSNDAHAEAWVRAFRAHGLAVPFDRVRARIGKGGDKLVREVAGLDKDDDPRAKAIDEDRSRLFLDEYLPHLRAFDGARALVERIRADGLTIVVASSAREKELKPLLKVAGVADLIERHTTPEDVQESKPDPDIVQAALKKGGLAADRAVMIGDTPYDVEAGAGAGVDVVAVRSGGWGDADLKGAIAVYDDVAQLLKEYDESPLGRSSRP